MNDARHTISRDACIVMAIALLPRLILALSMNQSDSVFIDWSYLEYAKHFAEGRGFWMSNPYSEGLGLEKVYAFRPPLFPFLWGCIYNVTQGHYWPIRITFAILSSVTCVLAYLAGLELTGQRMPALIGGLLCALYPPLIWHSVHLMTEPFFIFFTLAMFLALFRYRRTQRLRWLILAGAAAGLGTLSRSILVAFLPIAAIWLWWVRGRGKRAILDTALLTVIVLVVMSPWIIRNAVRFRAFVPTTTDAGHGFYVANNEHAINDPRSFWIPEDWSTVIEPGMDEVETARHLMRTTTTFLLKNPGTAIRLMGKRFVTLWRFYPNPDFVGKRNAWIYGLSYIPVFPFIILGLWLIHRGNRERLANIVLVDLLVVYTTVMSVVFLSMMRYRVPLMPFLLIAAALAMWEAWRRLAKNPFSARSVPQR